MKYLDNKVLNVNFDLRQRQKRAAQYIALKQFEKANKRRFIFDGFIIAAIVYCGIITGLYISLRLGAL